MLSAREIARKKMLAKAHEGISYVKSLDKFEVKVKVGKDIHGNYVYFKPIVRYDSIDKAIETANLYREMIEANMGRAKKVTIVRAIENRIKIEKEAIENGSKQKKSYLATLNNALRAFSVYDAAKNTNITNLTFDDIKGIIEHLRFKRNLSSTTIDNYNIIVKCSVKAYKTNSSEVDTKRSNHIRYLFDCANELMKNYRQKDKTEKQQKMYKLGTDTNLYSIDEMHRMLMYMEGELYALQNNITEQKWTRQRERATLKYNNTYVKYVAVKLLMLTGMRISELRGLTSADIDTNNLRIVISKQKTMQNYVQNTKTNNIRYVPITIELAADLDRIIAINTESEFIFDFIQDTVNSYIREAESACNVPHGDNVSHRFRHTIVSNLDNLQACRYCVGHVELNDGEAKRSDVHEKVYVHSTDIKMKKYEHAVYQYFRAIIKNDMGFEYSRDAVSEMDVLINNGSPITAALNMENFTQKAKQKFILTPREKRGDMSFDDFLKLRLMKKLKQFAAEEERIRIILRGTGLQERVLLDVWNNDLFAEAKDYKPLNTYEDFVADYNNGIFDKEKMKELYNNWYLKTNKPKNMLEYYTPFDNLLTSETNKQKLYQ